MLEELQLILETVGQLGDNAMYVAFVWLGLNVLDYVVGGMAVYLIYKAIVHLSNNLS